MDKKKVEQAIQYAHDVGFDEGYEVGYEDGYSDGLAQQREEDEISQVRTEQHKERGLA